MRILHFYPRPPGGGRLHLRERLVAIMPFLSTPSGWRATVYPPHLGDRFRYVYPRPPGGGRPRGKKIYILDKLFLSTPSGWRATRRAAASPELLLLISIHALRVEGDNKYNETPQGGVISIHALRVEGDRLGTLT